MNHLPKKTKSSLFVLIIKIIQLRCLISLLHVKSKRKWNFPINAHTLGLNKIIDKVYHF